MISMKWNLIFRYGGGKLKLMLWVKSFQCGQLPLGVLGKEVDTIMRFPSATSQATQKRIYKFKI